MEVKDLIKQKRIERGLTLKDVAKAVGVSEGTVSRWESGNIANMRRDRMNALAKTLNISPVDLLDGIEDAKNPPAEDNKKPSEYEGLSKNRIKLIEFAKSVPDDKAELILRVMRSIVEDD